MPTTTASERTHAPAGAPLTREEIEHFRTLLLHRRRAATGEIERMRAHLRDMQEAAREAAYSSDMADGASGLRERDELHLMIARQKKYVKHLDRALARIDEGTYGICAATGRTIPRGRLEAVPHATTCIEVKRRR